MLSFSFEGLVTLSTRVGLAALTSPAGPVGGSLPVR